MKLKPCNIWHKNYVGICPYQMGLKTAEGISMCCQPKPCKMDIVPPNTRSRSEGVSVEDNEKARRVYYQNLVYQLCNLIDPFYGPAGQKIVCGTIENPSDEPIHAMRYIIEGYKRILCGSLPPSKAKEECKTCGGTRKVKSLSMQGYNMSSSFYDCPTCSTGETDTREGKE